MDSLIDQFGSSLDSLVTGNQTHDNKFGTSYLYKYRQYCGLKQEERRQDLLSRQKKKRCRTFDEFRGVLDDAAENDNPKGYRPLDVPGFSKSMRKYANILMLSEWLVERPLDLESNWYLVPCPVGKRVVAVHTKGYTTCYNRSGIKMLSFPSALSYANKTKNTYTILDCVWNIHNKALYILDVLVWDSYSVLDSSTEFRRYWIETKFSETPKLTDTQSKFLNNIHLLPKISCSPESLNQAFIKFPFFPENAPSLDGWLLYHKDAIYESGTTPLVGWFKPYMTNEVLGREITVHNDYTLSKPDNYTNQAEFIKEFDKHLEKKNLRQQDSWDRIKKDKQARESKRYKAPNVLKDSSEMHEADNSTSKCEEGMDSDVQDMGENLTNLENCVTSEALENHKNVQNGLNQMDADISQ